MVEILTSFEQRLGRLEETILPVYQETGNLQRRQENIDKTLVELDHVINYYNVSKEVENVVREGPNGTTIDAFLEAMTRLKGALDYFATNNPGSIELENVRSLYSAGGSALSREFRELLSKHSKPVSAIDILNSLNSNDSVSDEAISHASSDDFSCIKHFPDNVQSTLIRISEWLCMNDREEYMNVYATVRANMMNKSLEHLRDHHKTSSGGSVGRTSPTIRKFASPAAATAVHDNSSTPGRKISVQSRRLQTALNRKVSSVTVRLEAATGYGRRGRAGGAVGEETVQEVEVDLFLTTLTGLQKLLASEQQLMVGIIPHQFQKKIFEIIGRDALDLVVKEGENITSKVKKSIANNDFLSILTLFYLLRHMTLVKPSIDKTLDGCDPSVRSKYNSLLHGLQTSGTMALDGFIDQVRTDGTTRERMPRDGTVFQLTSNVLMYLEQMVDYMDTIAEILGQDAAYNQQVLLLPRRILPQDRPQALLGLYIKKVLVQLNLTLVNKSDMYTDPFLRAVFRLNNNVYIQRALARSGLLDVVSLSAPECRENYDEMIVEQKRLYSQSWERVLNHIWASDDIPAAILQAPGKLSDKYCRIIKDKFSGFNKEIEDISSTQKHYSIPDVELRESLKRDNKEYILPKYNSFYEKYANVQFSKNTDKYIKYSPAQVSGLIESFFDVAA